MTVQVCQRIEVVYCFLKDNKICIWLFVNPIKVQTDEPMESIASNLYSTSALKSNLVAEVSHQKPTIPWATTTVATKYL